MLATEFNAGGSEMRWSQPGSELDWQWATRLVSPALFSIFWVSLLPGNVEVQLFLKAKLAHKQDFSFIADLVWIYFKVVSLLVVLVGDLLCSSSLQCLIRQPTQIQIQVTYRVSYCILLSQSDIRSVERWTRGDGIKGCRFTFYCASLPTVYQGRSLILATTVFTLGRFHCPQAYWDLHYHDKC